DGNADDEQQDVNRNRGEATPATGEQEAGATGSGQQGSSILVKIGSRSSGAASSSRSS
ncbi:unnamed protein product, partial [Amoebophrya sp. A25]